MEEGEEREWKKKLEVVSSKVAGPIIGTREKCHE